MHAIEDARLRPGRAAEHLPVEEGTSDGKTRISCAGSRCAGWSPRPCASRGEAQFWYSRHISQPLTHYLW